VTTYRAFILLKSDVFGGHPPVFIEAESDDEAIQKAQALLTNQDVEIWQSSRRVAVIQAQVIHR
jgi:hypothetical protein